MYFDLFLQKNAKPAKKATYDRVQDWKGLQLLWRQVSTRGAVKNKGSLFLYH